MHDTSGTFSRISARGLAAVALAALLVLSACGSSDDDSGALGSDDGSSDTPADDSGASGSDDGSGGDGTGTLTMTDGTVYEFEMTTCDTSNTDPAALPLSNGYDVFGKTSDRAFSLQIIRAGFDDENPVTSGGLEGDFDENGQNAGILYAVNSDSLNVLTVDGAKVSGEVSFRGIGPTGPHGDDAVGTVEVSC
jgi:hypothetical protein